MFFLTFGPELELDDGVDARQDEAEVAEDGGEAGEDGPAPLGEAEAAPVRPLKAFVARGLGRSLAAHFRSWKAQLGLKVSAERGCFVRKVILLLFCPGCVAQLSWT